MSESCAESQYDVEQSETRSKRKHEPDFTSEENVSSENNSSFRFHHALFQDYSQTVDDQFLHPSKQPIHDGSESEPNSEEDDSSSEAKQQQENGYKKLRSPSTSKVEKGSTTRDQQVKQNMFAKKFTFEDEKKILKALHRNHYKCADKIFWRVAGQSLKLSSHMTHRQIYEKVVRLKRNYIKRLTTKNSNHAMSIEERRLYGLSEKIWGEEGKTLLKLEEEYEKSSPVMYQGFGGDIKKDVEALRKVAENFPVADALKLVPASKRSKLEQKWKDLDAPLIQLYKRQIRLIKETMRAVTSSCSVE